MHYRAPAPGALANAAAISYIAATSMSSDPQDPAAPLRAPETPGARMPRAILRDLRTQGLAFVGRKSLATVRRKSQFLRYRYNLRSLVRSPDRGRGVRRWPRRARR